MKEKKILILMATYNGEEFIKKQIQSIQNQTYSNWQLLVQDDGSSDSTREIIKGFAKSDDRIRLENNSSNLHGAFANFYVLLQQVQNVSLRSKFDYFALSDQDDIWLPNKLAVQVSYLNEIDKTPALVYGNYDIIDENDKCILRNANKHIGLVPNVPETLFFANAYVWGNTVMFNDKLLKQLKISSKIIASGYPHDAYLAKIATITGELKFIDEILVDYRRFSGNVSSTMWYKLSIRDFIHKLKPSVRAKTLGVTVDQGLLILSQFPSSKNTDLVAALRNGGFVGLKYLIRKGIRRQQRIRTLALYIILFSGIYKKWLRIS